MTIYMYKTARLLARIHSTYKQVPYFSLIAHLYNLPRKPSNSLLISPVIAHTSAMSLSIDGESPSKTMAFRCFQSSHIHDGEDMHVGPKFVSAPIHQP